MTVLELFARIAFAAALGLVTSGALWSIWTAENVGPAGAMILSGLIVACVGLIALAAEATK